MIPFISIFIFPSACSHFCCVCVCNFLLFFGSTYRFAFLYLAKKKTNTNTHIFFFHFMPLLKPLGPLFPFPAMEHVVFIFYIDDTGSVVLCCVLLAESIERTNGRCVRLFVRHAFSSFLVLPMDATSLYSFPFFCPNVVRLLLPQLCC